MTIPNDPISRGIPPQIPPSLPADPPKLDDSLQSLGLSTTIQGPQLGGQRPVSGSLLIPIEISSLESQEKEIQQLLDQAVSIDPSQAIRAQELVDRVAERVVTRVLQEDSKRERPTEITEPGANLFSIVSTVDTQLEQTNLGINIDGEILEPLILEEAFFREVAALEIGVVAANVLSRAGAAMATGMLLVKIKEIIEVKENSLGIVEGEEKAHLEKEIAVLKKWLAFQTHMLSDQLKSSLLMSTLSTPKVASAVVGVLEITGTVAGETIGWIGLGGSLIRSAINWHNAHHDLKDHEAWTKTIRNSGISISDAESIVVRQRMIFEERLKKNKPVLENLLRTTIAELDGVKDSDPKAGVESALNKLKAVGIVIPLEKLSINELKDFLSSPANYSLLNRMMVEKKEAHAVSLRNGLRTFADQKEKIDKGFLQFNLNKAKGLFTAAMVITALTITLKVLAVIGITVAGVVLTATGYGMLVFLLGFMLIGGVYLYVKKPNIFKTYVQGVQARLLFNKIPLAIQNLRRNYAFLEANRISEDIRGLANRILEVDKLMEGKDRTAIEAYIAKHSLKLPKNQQGNSEAILKNYREKLDAKKTEKSTQRTALIEKLQQLSISMEEMEKKVQVLQDRVDQAGWKDFQRHLYGKENVYDQQHKEIDVSKVFADALMEDSLLEDSETKKILDYMEIDVKMLKRIPQSASVETARVLRAFFAMEEDSTMKMISKQNFMQNSKNF